MIPQMILLFLFFMSLGVSIAKHGQPKEGNYSVRDNVISLAIVITLLWWGGFFDNFYI